MLLCVVEDSGSSVTRCYHVLIERHLSIYRAHPSLPLLLSLALDFYMTCGQKHTLRHAISEIEYL